MVDQNALVNLFESFETWGVTDVLLPFLLIFTIIFAVLQKTKILGAGKKQFNVIISLVVSLSVVIPHVTRSYPMGFDVVEIINVFLPQIALIAVILIMILILIGVFAPAFSGWIAIAGAVIVALLFFGTTRYLYGINWLYEVIGEETLTLAVILIVFGVIIWFIVSEPKSGEKATAKVGEWMKELFK